MERYVGKEVNDFWGGRQMKVGRLLADVPSWVVDPLALALTAAFTVDVVRSVQAALDLREMLVILEERKEITNQGFYGWRNVLYRAGAYEFEGTYCLLAGGSHGQEDGRRGFFRIGRCG